MESYIDELNYQVQEKKSKLEELESEWDADVNVLQEKKRNIEQSLQVLYPEVYSKLTRIKEIKLETQAVETEIKRREDEIVKLSSDIGKHPKLCPRRTYIEQINEVTKNSRKQDADIQLILKDTRELQLESNTIQERLNRTFAVLEETILREAKKDAVAQKAHMLLTSIHETFEHVTDKILAADRSRRSIADYEAKLAIYDSRSLNMDRLRVDLDAIRKENDLVEQRLHNT
ncbi:coiled-coil domain-containing protein 22 [Dorcoceras hygrometricum]|uniref:Coiled-coil domain-containing protein 22 n=1 Tax=Dorcoceras hygrometricum TaxID=472368 RepID=A0A2Z7B7D3_9LAMI|nr:coiled-coil domain-containing protein 22 [Dorcoceras hygrometricum]